MSRRNSKKGGAIPAVAIQPADQPAETSRTVHIAVVVDYESVQNYKFFDSYSIRRHEGFLFLKLFYTSEDRRGHVVFSGAISSFDCDMLDEMLKEYFAKISGVGETAKNVPPPVSPDNGPDMFHHIDVIRRGRLAEIIISSFSHRNVNHIADRLQKSPKLVAENLGIFTSSSALHKKLIFDLIEAINAPGFPEPPDIE